MKNIAIVIYLILALNRSFGQDTYTLDMESILNKRSFLSIENNYIDKIEYLPLQTNESCLIGNGATYTLTETYIVVIDTENCFLFDRSTGKFIRKIGNKGRGPGEYFNTNGFLQIEDQLIYFTGNNGELLQYNLNGDFIKTISIPEINNDFNSPSIPTKYSYLDKLIIAYFGNILGTEEKLISISNQDGNIIRLIPNHNQVEKKSSMSFSLEEAQFYHINNELYFKEDYSDTIFKVSKTGIKPHLIIALGKYRPPYESKWYSANDNEDITGKLVYTRKLRESKNLLLFEFEFNNKNYQAIYNKNVEQLYIDEKQEEIEVSINGYISFYPTSNVLDNYVLGCIDSYKVSDWFRQNSGKIQNIPADLQKLRKVKESDNPIIMIAKLKK